MVGLAQSGGERHGLGICPECMCPQCGERECVYMFHKTPGRLPCFMGQPVGLEGVVSTDWERGLGFPRGKGEACSLF